MPEVQDTGYLSIGEVLGLLLEEFPDVTISKIRFLESQGLIDPERTPSGYRKFYVADVDLLRVILREQRENYLPLRVIKDRLDSGAIDPSGELPKPVHPAAHVGYEPHDHTGDDHTGDVEVPSDSIAGHPAATRTGPVPTVPSTTTPPDPASNGHVEDNEPARSPRGTVPAEHPAGHTAENPEPDRRAEPTVVPTESRSTPRLLPGVVLDRDELRAMVGLTASELDQLESYGIVVGRGSGSSMVYGEDAVEIAKLAVEFLRAGVDARHLRGWRSAADREASLYEQLITPRLRQRNPEATAEARERLRRLDALGAKLRDAMMRTALRHHFEG